MKDSKATLKQALRPVCEGDSLGVGPHRRGRCGRLRDQQQLSRWSRLRWNAQTSRRRFRRHLHPRSGREMYARIPSSQARRTTSLAFRSASASTFFVKKNGKEDSQVEMFYARVDEFWRKEEKYRYLEERSSTAVSMEAIMPDKRHTWLTEGHHAEFETFVPWEARKQKRQKGEAVDVIFQSLASV